MIKLDVSQLPEHIATVLMLRGAGLPRVDWSQSPCRPAKELLERIDADADLLGVTRLADENAAVAVRAALFLWAGHLADAEMYAQATTEPTRLYLTALCRRHAGKPDEAKALLRDVGDHPGFPALVEYAKEAIALGASQPLKRFRDMIEMTGDWEPFAYIDTIEQARAGKLDSPGEIAVRSLQCREFEVLLSGCYEAATGQPLAQVRAPDPTPAPRRRPKAKPTPRGSRPSPPAKSPPAAPATQANTQTPAKAASSNRQGEDRIGIRCPKCTYVCSFSPSVRGTVQRCAKCGTPFRIPIAHPDQARKTL